MSDGLGNIKVMITRLEIKTEKEIALVGIRQQDSTIFALKLSLPNRSVDMAQIENKPEDCMDTESGLTTCGTKGTSTTEQLPTNSDIFNRKKKKLIQKLIQIYSTEIENIKCNRMQFCIRTPYINNKDSFTMCYIHVYYIVQVQSHSFIADSRKNAFSKADLLLRNSALHGVLIKGIR